MGMSAFYKDQDHTATDEESISVIHRALELGVTMLDTAEVYGPHTNEVLVGKAIAGNRDAYVVATKFGITMSGTDGSPENVRRSVEGSLQRLGIQTIDLYYLHRMDPNTPIETTVKAMAELVKEGKVRYLGLSEVSPKDLRRAHAVHPITAVQLEWSLWTRDVEAELVPTCRELGIGIVAYSPLGRGFLTGKYNSLDDLAEDDWRRSNPRFKEAAFKKNLALVEKVKELAAAHGCTPGQLALAWVHAQGQDVFPIPGTKRVKYLEENAAAFNVQLSKADLEALEAAVPHDQVEGERYDEAFMERCFDRYDKAAGPA
jgi:aryl-alcohol dehydrogenase-like predicted oxidoreductase